MIKAKMSFDTHTQLNSLTAEWLERLIPTPGSWVQIRQFQM